MKKAFTLIELLVVVAIIALLISILLPALKSARENARSVVCGQRLHDIGIGLNTYGTEEQDWIPGANTSGFAAFAMNGTPSMHDAKVPVQVFDYFTPALCRSTPFPSPRAAHFKEIYQRYACPSMNLANRSVKFTDGTNPSPDQSDFNADKSWTSCSYLMPSAFQYWGTDWSNAVLGTHYQNSNLKYTAKTIDPGWEIVHKNYRSMFRQVGTPSDKIASADGTRFVTADGNIDFDFGPNPKYFGAFTSQSAWWMGSREYGPVPGSMTYNNKRVQQLQSGSVTSGEGLPVSYRHGTPGSKTATDNKGTINALFFDGAVRRLKDQDSRNATLWYPKGAKVNAPDQGMNGDFKINDIIP